LPALDSLSRRSERVAGAIPAAFPGAASALASRRERFVDWADRWSAGVFVMPAVLVVLALSIFPLIVSLYLSLSRLRFERGGVTITYIGLLNYEKLLFGSQQFHLLGKLMPITPLGWSVVALVTVLLGFWLFRAMRRGVRLLGLFGRFLVAVAVIGLALLVNSAASPGGQLGTLGVTLIYVFVGVLAQYAIGLGLAMLCVQNLRGRNFFRVVFFLPMMITPVGVAYTFRMLTDTTKGPFAPIWQAVGLGEFAWASTAWGARIAVMIGDAWQWIPFMFIVLLAALESQPRDQIEAAHVDGASRGQIFRFITWPALLPVTLTLVLIRVIEAFKIVDLPNVLTNGGPGIASESMTLHAYSTWRALDLGGSAAIAYMLLFVVTFFCLAFVNLARARVTGAAAR
jgi:multiple sugar transport system permease protein